MHTFSFSEALIALPELILILFSLVLLIYVALRGEKETSQTASTVVVAFIIAAGAVFFQPDEKLIGFNGLYIVDAYTKFIKLLVLAAAASAVLMIMPHWERFAIKRAELPLLILFTVLGMLLMVSAHDLMSLFLGIELQSLSVYIITAFQRDDLKSNEAAIKYFILGALSSAVLLYGFSLIYGYAGTTNFEGLEDAFRTLAESSFPIGLLFGLIFVLCGLAFKASLVPFHMWTPDVYEGVPLPTTAFFAAVPKVAIVGLLLRVILGPFELFSGELRLPLIILALGSIFVGAISAVYQQNLKRLLAYSSISHVGFVLLGVIALNDIGVRGILFYLVIYLLMTLATFGCLLLLKRGGRSVEEIKDLTGLGKTNPLLAFFLSALMLSLAGIPPLAGFYGKFFVIMGILNAGHLWIAIAAVVGSMIGIFYYLRLIKVMYFDKTTLEETLTLKALGTAQTSLVLVACFIGIIVFSLTPGLLYDQTLAASAVLLMR